MARSIGSATLTDSWADIGTIPVPGYWLENKSGGRLTLRIKYTKAGATSGGIPWVRVRYKTHNAAGTEVTSLDPLMNSTTTIASGVATLEAATGEVKITALTDSDGTIEFDLPLDVPPFKEKILVQAKQSGDTTAGHFGVLVAELDGQI
jgi:hypothetical protein